MNERSLQDAVAAQPAEGIGVRLRRGREAMGLSVAETAARLRLSTAVVEALERENLEALGAAVYVRGYLGSYARLVGLPGVVVDSTVARLAAAPPELRSATHGSPGRRLAERYARQAVYIVLTASIVVPVVWLATQERLPVDGAALRSLDAPPAANLPIEVASRQPAAPEHAPPGSSALPGPPEAAARADEAPVVASFAPFLGQRPPARSAANESDAGWHLRFSGDSWVEVLDAEGRRLEYGLVRAGSERRFPAGSVARVALGNADGVEVMLDGVSVPLAPFRRANVARFKVSSGGDLEPAGG